VGGSRPPYDVDGYSTRDVSNADPFGAAETPSPWFLKPWVLALWGLTVLLLIAIIIYGLVILATNNGGGAPATTRPSTTTSSTAPARTTTPSSTLPSTTAPAPETTTEPLPPVISPTWTPQQRPHRHWWNGNVPQLPGMPPIHVPGVNP
jgi:cell division septation protein DedD